MSQPTSNRNDTDKRAMRVNQTVNSGAVKPKQWKLKETKSREQQYQVIILTPNCPFLLHIVIRFTVNIKILIIILATQIEHWKSAFQIRPLVLRNFILADNIRLGFKRVMVRVNHMQEWVCSNWWDPGLCFTSVVSTVQIWKTECG